MEHLIVFLVCGAFAALIGYYFARPNRTAIKRAVIKVIEYLP